MKIIDAGLKFESGHEVRSGKPKGIVLHHAVSNGSVEQIHRSHLNRGWIGIGYHFYVRKDGSVYRGRPENWIGAHAVGHNTKIGICAEGNYMEDTMGKAQKQAIIEVIAYLLEKYGDLSIYRHKDVDATACPGANYPFTEIVNSAKKNGKVEVQEEKKSEGESTVNITLNVLKKGSEGEQVKNLQRLLVAKGHKLEKYGVDGDFGNETDAAVRAFQKANKLTIDGIVGQQTWNKLLKG